METLTESRTPGDPCARALHRKPHADTVHPGDRSGGTAQLTRATYIIDERRDPREQTRARGKTLVSYCFAAAHCTCTTQLRRRLARARHQLATRARGAACGRNASRERVGLHTRVPHDEARIRHLSSPPCMLRDAVLYHKGRASGASVTSPPATNGAGVGRRARVWLVTRLVSAPVSSSPGSQVGKGGRRWCPLPEVSIRLRVASWRTSEPS